MVYNFRVIDTQLLPPTFSVYVELKRTQPVQRCTATSLYIQGLELSRGARSEEYPRARCR